MRYIFMLVITICALGLSACTGSATEVRSTSTTETVTGEPAAPNKGNFPAGRTRQENPAVNGQSTTTVEKERTTTAAPHVGIFGTTVHFIGQVLAFPFKLIAGIIEFIF